MLFHMMLLYYFPFINKLSLDHQPARIDNEDVVDIVVDRLKDYARVERYHDVELNSVRW